MPYECIRCRRPRPSFDDHELCAQCRVAAGKFLLDTSNPCGVYEVWPMKTRNKLRKALGDARTRAIQQGKQHWTSAFSQIEAWITNRPASIAASEPGSEFSSIADSGDDFCTINQFVSTKGSVVGDFEVHESIGVNTNMADCASAAMPPMIAAMPQTPGTIETSVPIVNLPQATPSVSGSAGGVPISHTAEQQYTLAQPQMAQTQMAMPQMALPRAAMPLATMEQVAMPQTAMQQTPPMQTTLQPLAMQMTAMPSMVPPSTMMARSNQLGFVSAPLDFQGTQFQGSYMPNPGWQPSGREQLLQDQLQRERQEFQAWKIEVSKNLVPTQLQAQAPSLVDLTEPPMNIDAPVEVID